MEFAIKSYDKNTKIFIFLNNKLHFGCGSFLFEGYLLLQESVFLY
jgi:hypothetical protein